MTDDPAPPAAAPAAASFARCTACWARLKPNAAFCSTCGRETGATAQARAAAQAAAPQLPVAIAQPSPSLSMAMRMQAGDVKMVIWYFVLSLAAAAAWMAYAQLTDDAFHTVVGGTLTLGALTLAFAIPNRALIAEPARRLGFGPLGYLAIAIAAVPIALLVAGYVDAMHALFGIHVPSELAEFAGKSAIWPIVMIVILPPLEEELAFRGLIYGGLRKSLTVSETFIVSAFAFAILHLSVPSLVTHVPLGLYLVWLRHRSNSLWPGVFAHACHNLGICVLEWIR